MKKPEAFDKDGCNLDPMLCDCGKGDYCPLWNDGWRRYYGIITKEA